MRTVIIIQARMGSSRLPGKVLKDIDGRPMLEWVIRRGMHAKLLDEVMVATTIDSTDDPIENWCMQHKIRCWRGSVFDVLDRYYCAAKSANADTIVRVTADCPLIDPDVLDDTVQLFRSEAADFAANRLPPPWHRTFPIGLDVEVVSMPMLERAWKEADKLFEREHVMPYFYDTEGRCRVSILNHDPDYGMHRWTVDTLDDFLLVEKIFTSLNDPLTASWLDVLHLIEKHPELEKINETTHAKRVDDVDKRSEIEK